MVVIGLEKDVVGLQGGSEFFAERTGIRILADDTSHVALHQFFPVSRGDGSRNASDFVIINGIAGTPSHRQWEILFSQSGSPSTASLRKAINSVAAPDPVEAIDVMPVRVSAPTLGGGRLSMTISGQVGVTYVIQTSSDLKAWFDQDEVEGQGGEQVLSLSQDATVPSRFIRIRAEVR